MSIITLYAGILEAVLLKSSCHASTPEEQYSAAIRSSKILNSSPERKKYRHNWINCIKKFQAVYTETPNHSLASSGMYHAAQLYLDLHKISAIQKDKSEAIDLLNRIIKRYPSSTDRDMAERLLNSIVSTKTDQKDSASAQEVPQKKASKRAASQAKMTELTKTASGKKEDLPKTTESAQNASVSSSKNGIISSSNGNAYITDLRYWTTPDYTRVVVNISDERKYIYQFLEENPSMKKPQRLYLDIKNSVLSENLPSHTRINDDLLIQARAGQHTEDTVRVVVDIKSFDNYKVFSLKDPFRVIIDVWGAQSDRDAGSKISSEDTKTPAEAVVAPSAPDTSQPTEVAKTEQTVTSGSDNAEIPESEISYTTPDGVITKKSTKKLTRTAKASTTETQAITPSYSSEDASKTASSINLQSEEEPPASSISSKTSTKTATKPSYVQSLPKSETLSKQSSESELDFETNAKEASSLPVKRSIKNSTMALSSATREMLRTSLGKKPEEPSEKTTRTNSKKASKKSSEKATKGTTRVVQQIAPGSNIGKIKAASIAKQLALGVRTIVIDPGHGGKDPGASGYSKGIYEKDVVLAISKKLSAKIRSRLNCNVIMTRSNDKFLTLEERTAIANTKNADLFISLHCNASNDKNLVGIETYYLNLATDDRAINVAARENATSRKNISDLEDILNDLMKNSKINESSRLSAVVQNCLHKGISKKYSNIKNLGVKQAPFYVLLGASMPSILIETSFLSNPEECRRLTDSTYQNALCDAIINGITQYMKETNPQRL